MNTDKLMKLDHRILVPGDQELRRIKMFPNKIMFSSSSSGKWDTPQDLIDDLKEVFIWDLDVCASKSNVCPNYFSENDDGLSKDWHGLCWMNPPYGREIGNWLSKALDESLYNDATVICLVPARTDTRWWHDYVKQAHHVCFVKGRLTFGDDEYWIRYWCEKYKSNNISYHEVVKSVGSGYLAKAGAVDSLRDCTVDYMCNFFRCPLSPVKKNAAPFPSALVVFGKLTPNQILKLASYGWLLFL